jgi:small subunit ribosomal protein S2
LPYYIEPKLVLISDPQVDEQAITEATNAGIPVIGIANTDNITSKVDLVIPANNRGRKALATTYWLLASEILIQKGELKDSEQMKYEIDDFETKIIEEEKE